MEILYANGDSFVFGMECIADASMDPLNKELAFPKRISDKLNCETYINNAYNSATNEFIFRTTIFDLLELEQKGVTPSDVFVVIGWTTLHRFEIEGKTWYQKTFPGIDPIDVVPGIQERMEYVDYNTLFVSPGFHTAIGDPRNPGSFFSTEQDIVPFCVDYVWHDHIQNPQHESRLLALHAFLTAKGYKHIFLNTAGRFQFKMLDTSVKNFYKLDTDTFYDWGRNHYPAEIKKYRHFSPAPHLVYGNLLVDYIRENIL